MHDEWFADEEKVRKAVGLLEEPVVPFPDGREVCSLCFACLLSLIIFFCEFDAMNAPALTDDLRDLFRNLSF